MSALHRSSVDLSRAPPAAAEEVVAKLLVRASACLVGGVALHCFHPVFPTSPPTPCTHAVLAQPPSQSGYALSLSGEDKIMCINKYITGCRYQSKTGCAAMWCGSCCTPELLWGSNCSAKGMCGFKVETDARRRRRGTVCPFWQVPFRKAGACLHPTQPPPPPFTPYYIN